jgi:hypothetical protein
MVLTWPQLIGSKPWRENRKQSGGVGDHVLDLLRAQRGAEPHIPSAAALQMPAGRDRARSWPASSRASRGHAADCLDCWHSHARKAFHQVLAARHKVPVAYGQLLFAEIDWLISYGSNIVDAWRQAGVYVGRILKGANGKHVSSAVHR